MRKYVLNRAIIAAAVSAITTFRTGQAGPHDWRFYCSIAASVLTLAVAVGTVHKESQEMAEEGHGF
jgi:hypothetical protein